MGIMLSPVLGVELKNWDIGSDPLKVLKPFNGRDTYFIYYCYGTTPLPFTFSMDFKVIFFSVLIYIYKNKNM